MRALFLGLLLPLAAVAQDGSARARMAAIAQDFCVKCHGAEDPEAGLDLGSFLAREPSGDDAETWIDLRDVLQSGDMPPADATRRPSDAERKTALTAVQECLSALSANTPVDPGRVTMRRLSRVEYAATIHDLCGVTVDPREFPADDLAYGFDNNGDALTLSPLHLEKYAAAAERIAARALPDPDPVVQPVVRIDSEDLESTFPQYAGGDGAVLISTGTAGRLVTLPRAGRYRVRVIAYATQAGDELARMELSIDDQRIERFTVENGRKQPGSFAVEATLGEHADLRAAFINDFYDPENPDPERRDRNLIVQGFLIEGPLDLREPTAFEQSVRKIEAARGTSRAQAAKVMRAFLRRAWRRPPRQVEIDRLARMVARLVDDGESFRAALRVAIAAAIVSPHFLFRVEPQASTATGITALDDHALAVRLSYYLWSSMPDDELFAHARSKQLHAAGELRTEALRMLDDPRADALATVFAAQWLELRRLDLLVPDPQRFPGYDQELAASMRQETQLLFSEVLREGLPVSTLLLADHSFVDARLASHYGMPPPKGDGFERRVLSGARLGGLLGQASILAITSHPTRTSPVRRGKWLLDELLGAPPSAPLPGKDSFPPDAPLDTPMELREQLARHRADPSCAVCHDRMDPLGLALEGFDPLGRDRGGEQGIDTRGRLPDGRILDGAADLSALIARDPAFPRCVLRKLFVFALGRPLGPSDALALDRELAALPADPPLRDLVLAVIHLDAFRLRAPQKELR